MLRQDENSVINQLPLAYATDKETFMTIFQDISMEHSAIMSIVDPITQFDPKIVQLFIQTLPDKPASS